jgi:hypothetical protein
MLAVDCVGKSGGLALLWGDEVRVKIQNYSCHHINAKISPKTAVVAWKLTGFYGHLEVGKWVKHGSYSDFFPQSIHLHRCAWVISMRSLICRKNGEEMSDIDFY